MQMKRLAEKVGSAVNPLAFIKEHKIRNENGLPINFKNHQFLIRPYADLKKKQVAMKAAQIGWSVMNINKTFFLADQRDANVIYTLPTRTIVKDFVVPKVDPIIEQNPVYQQMIGETNSTALKAVGERFIFYRGSWEETAAISISAHVLVNDELDRSDQKVIRTYRSRLDDALRERPDLGYIWQFSNPSIPGAGVDEVWQKSDQKHWFVKCRYCGFDWYLDWPESVDFQKKIYVCTKCHKELTDDDRRSGRWVVKNKDSDISGYWVSQLMAPWIPAAKVIEDSELDQQFFYNFTLGKPYVSKDFSVTRETITGCLSPDTNKMTNVAIGVDNGVTKTVVIGNVHGIFKIYETKDWSRIEDDIKRYNATCVIDSLPYPATPIKLSQQYRGRVYIHYFNENKRTATVIEWGKKDRRNVVYSDRTKIIDMLVAELIEKQILFNMTLSELDQYVFDWTQLYRDIEVNAKGIARPVWRTIEGRRDHYALATVYWRIALEKTYSISGVVRDERKTGKMGMDKSVAVSPEGEVPGPDLDKILERATKGKKSWKTI